MDQEEAGGAENDTPADALSMQFQSELTDHRGKHYTVRKRILRFGVPTSILAVIVGALVHWREPLTEMMFINKDRVADITFPPRGLAVPRTVDLRARAHGILHDEDLRIEIHNQHHQFWYKKLSWGEGDQVTRTNLHFGLLKKDVGEIFRARIVVVKPGIHLSEDVYDRAQPVERVGHTRYFVRRPCEEGEKLSPESWKIEAIAKKEIEVQPSKNQSNH